MKVRDLIKCVGYEPTPTNSNDSYVNQGSTSSRESVKINNEYIENHPYGDNIYVDNTQSFIVGANTITTFPVLEETNLDDDETAEVLSYLLKLQDEYFGPSLPLADELCKKFVWNMPSEVYKSFKDSLDYDVPDALNILTLFYAFCMKDVSRTGMFKFIDRLRSMIDEVETQEILDTIYYDDDYADEPYDDESPTDNSFNSTDEDSLITTT